MTVIVKILQGLLGLLLLSTNALAAPLHEEDIELGTASGALRGTLTAPAPPSAAAVGGGSGTPATRPLVVLMIGGSGPTDRDGNGPGFHPNSLRQLAHALARAGHAVVRYDKRGVGASMAAARSEADLRFTHYVDDATRWAERLSRDPRFAGLVVLGHSEGALIGAMVSARMRPRGFISIEGVASPAGDVLRHQLAGKLPPELELRSDAILQGLEQERLSNDVPEALLPLYRPSVQPYLVSWMRVRPTQEYARLGDVPTLIVHGSSDLQVSVEESKALHAALPASTLEVIPGMNHVFKIVSGDESAQRASYIDPEAPLSAALVQAINDFLSRSPAKGPPAAASMSR